MKPAIAILFFVAGLPAFGQGRPSPVVVKAGLDFDKVDSSPVPTIEDTLTCAQSNAAALPIVRLEERYLFHYRKGYCELLGAVLTSNSSGFRAASGDFGEALVSWPPKMLVSPPAALPALVTIARLEQGRRADAFTDIVRDLTTSVNDGACPATPIMSAAFCAGVIDTARTWLGWLALRKGNFPQAAQQLAALPASPWTAWVAGRVAQNQKRLAEAATLYQKALDTWGQQSSNPDVVTLLGPKPDRAEVSYQLALIDYDNRRFASAISRFDLVLRESPRNSYALFLRGRSKEALEQYGPALEDYGSAVQAAQAANDSSWPVGQAYFSRGVLLYRQKEFSRAEAEFAAAFGARLSEVPQADVTAWRILASVSGSACMASLDTLESIYKATSDQFPKAEAYALLIECRLKLATTLDQYLAVEKQYGASLDPGRLRVLRNRIAADYADLGVAAEDRKDSEAAVTAYRQALQWNPVNAKAHFNLGAIYIDAKQFDLAEAEYRALVEADASDYEAHYWLAASILAQRPPLERVASACEILRHALLIGDVDKRAQFYRAFTAAKCPK